jgi:hypothetical protein
MKFESRTEIVWFETGKTSLGASGPSTSGTGGSGGAGRGVMPRSKVETVGGETGGEIRGDGPVAGGWDGFGTGADWQPDRPATMTMAATFARRWVRMREGM